MHTQTMHFNYRLNNNINFYQHAKKITSKIGIVFGVVVAEGTTETNLNVERSNVGMCRPELGVNWSWPIAELVSIVFVVFFRRVQLLAGSSSRRGGGFGIASCEFGFILFREILMVDMFVWRVRILWFCVLCFFLLFLEVQCFIFVSRCWRRHN